MIHPDVLYVIAEQRGSELRVAAHRHRLHRYAQSFRERRSVGDLVRHIPTPALVRRRRLVAASAAPPETCCCAG